MQSCDLIHHKNPSFRNDHSIMSGEPSTPTPDEGLPSSPQHKLQNDNPNSHNGSVEPNLVQTTRSNRPLRACTARAAARLYTPAPVIERKSKQAKRRERKDESRSPSPEQQCNSRIVTPLVSFPVPPSLVPRWGLRSMWELASILNFLHVFRHLLNINVEFAVEELETALLTPNGTLSDVHIPLLKAIPPVTRMALGRDTWVTVLCRKLRDWWHWVAEGDIPIIASHGTEVEAYNALEPAVRVVILKALCDIRVEQEDIRSYIDSSIKHGVHLSAFRKDRVGGDSQGISYWYEGDPIIGHRLYRQIRTIDVKKVKGKGSQVLASATYQWETVATNLDEFQDVSEKLFSSKNRTEASLGKKLKNDMLPEIEKVHKRKERLLKKQHREALLLNNYWNMEELGPGRSLRDRKPVTYTFDDFDRSINEAIMITKHKQPSPEPTVRREGIKPEASTNGRLSAPSQAPNVMFSSLSPQSPDYDEFDDENNAELERRNRRRQRPQRYSEKEFVEAPSENEADFDSDDIVGEAVYDEEYLKKRKQRQKLSSSSEGDEEYNWDAENGEDEEDEEEDSTSISEDSDSDEPRRGKKLPGRTRNETKSRSVNELQSGLRRSKRATKNRINYRKYDLSESESESMKPNKSKKAFDGSSDASNNNEDSDESNENIQQMEVDKPVENTTELVKQEQNQSPEKSNKPGQNEADGGVQNRHFLDLNELAPGSGFDDVPNSMKDNDTGNF